MATILYQANTIYEQVTNIVLKCQIYVTYANDLMCINGGGMPIHMPHINSLAWAKWPQALYVDSDDTNNDDTAWLY